MWLTKTPGTAVGMQLRDSLQRLLDILSHLCDRTLQITTMMTPVSTLIFLEQGPTVIRSILSKLLCPVSWAVSSIIAILLYGQQHDQNPQPRLEYDYC